MAFLRLFLLLTLLSAFSYKTILAEDTVVVQTLTFDDLFQRRGLYTFPDNDDTYRKILLYYTLKCDPSTESDEWFCGEWDVITSNFLYLPTGRMDSTAKEHPEYKIGSVSPDIIEYTSIPVNNIYQKELTAIVYDDTLSENEFELGTKNSDFTLPANSYRSQFLFTNNELKAAGLDDGTIDRLLLNVKSGNGTLKYFTVRVKGVSQDDIINIDNSGMETVFQNDLLINGSGKVPINFTTAFDKKKFKGMLVDISYEMQTGTEPIVLEGDNLVKSIQINSNDDYLEFEGSYDFIDCGIMPELDGAEKFTFEGWFKISDLNIWRNIWHKSGQFYMSVTNANKLIIKLRGYSNAQTSSAIPLNEWIHIAVVYDGTQTGNIGKYKSEGRSNARLKVFINGSQQSLGFFYGITNTTHDTQGAPFYLGNGGTFKGFMNDIRIWTDALDPNTIRTWIDKPILTDHPNYSSLLAYYPIDNESGLSLKNEAPDGEDAMMFGIPALRSEKAENFIFAAEEVPFRPAVTIIDGEYESHLTKEIISDTIPNSRISIDQYEIEDYQPRVRNQMDGFWLSGWGYTYATDGKVIDSTFFDKTAELTNSTLNYFTKPAEVLDRIEIGRFITPYGINLDMNPDGFTWVYDVTDYAPLLRGEVDLSAGDDRELIDMKFVMIKGTPPRNVLKIDKIWEHQSRSYKSLSDNSALSEKSLPLLKEAKQFKIKTRLTGHGHNSNDGSSPHCCEWKDNTHFLSINGNPAAQWHVWEHSDCALNPVYPQGGTWPGAREGWCPGAAVDDYDFEITDLINSDSVKIDYDITKVPDNNLGMGNGSYVQTFHLIQYSEPNFTNDAGIFDVIAPTDNQFFARTNPICTNPKVIIQNNGKNALTSLKFEYYVSGGEKETFNWSGEIKSMRKDTITLPLPNKTFWLGDESHKFTVEISEPNGSTDEYDEDNSFTTTFNMPDMFGQKIVLEYLTNNYPSFYSYTLKDFNDNVVFERAANSLAANTTYTDELNIPKGCYTLEFVDVSGNDFGLSYWAVPQLGNGYLRITDEQGKALKSFDPDFGRSIIYSFNYDDLTHVENPGREYSVNVLPNPANDKITLKFIDAAGKTEFQIYDELGNLLITENSYVYFGEEKQLDISKLNQGGYFIRIKTEQYVRWEKFIKE